jgi:hypothetical protein
LSIFYLIPIAFAAWFIGQRVGILITIASVATWLFSELLGDIHYLTPFVPYWNGAFLLNVFIIIVFLILKIKTLNEHLEKKIEERTVALIAEVDERTPIAIFKLLS